MNPSPEMNYLHITSEAGMAMKMPPAVISLSGRVPEELQNPPELGLMMMAASVIFVELCSGT